MKKLLEMNEKKLEDEKRKKKMLLLKGDE